MAEFFNITLASLIGSSVAGAVTGAVLLRRNRQVEESIRATFNERLKVFESTRGWQEKCLAELLGPVVMQLNRTKLAFDRWNGRNLYLEAKIVREGNLAIRDTLLAKGHLIPPDLAQHAIALVAHYDRWLEEFDRVRSEAEPGDADSFVFVAQYGVPFPREAEAAFKAKFAELQQALYGLKG